MNFNVHSYWYAEQRHPENLNRFWKNLAIQFIKYFEPPHQQYVGFAHLHPNKVLFIIPTAPFQPPTEEWQKILGDIRKGIDKIDNDFSTTCQGKKVCHFDCLI